AASPPPQAPESGDRQKPRGSPLPPPPPPRPRPRRRGREPIAIARSSPIEQHDSIEPRNSTGQDQNHHPRSQRLEVGDGSGFHGCVRSAAEKNQAGQPMNRQPALVAHAVVIGKATKQQKQIEDDDIDRTGRLRPERDEYVTDRSAAFKLYQSQENDVCDQEQDGRWPEDSMEAHRAIETAKNGLQRVSANDCEHGNGHQSNRP